MTKLLKFPRMGQGRNVAAQPPGAGEVESVLTPIDLIQGLYGLWCSRIITMDALFLGTQVCQKMMSAKVSQIVMTGEEAQTHVCQLNGTLYTGALSDSMGAYVAALQDLQFRGALLNDIAEPRLYEAEKMRSHFTLSPEATAGKHYSFKTPIYYRLAPVTKDEFFGAANKLASARLQGCTPLDIGIS